MPKTYEPIATTTLGSNQSTISFTSISGSFTDLRIIINGNLTSLEDIGVRFNSDSNAVYSFTGITGNGSTASSNRQSNQTYAYVGSLDGSQSMTIYDIFNYANTTTNKTFLNRTSAAGWVVYARVGLWRSTAAITSISLTPVNQFAAGTVATLYGIESA